MALQVPNIDNKTFLELFEESRRLIPRYAPDWTDHNLSDPGITFLDLFAWLSEMQMYGSNRVTDRHRLKFLRMLGIEPEPAKPARVSVTFGFDEKSPPEPISQYIGKGTPVGAVDSITGEEIVFETDGELEMSPLELTSVLTCDDGQWIDNTEFNEWDGVFYFAFGRRANEHSEIYLGFTAPLFPTHEITLTVSIFDADLPELYAASDGSKVFPSADLIWEYWNGTSWHALTVKDDGTAFMQTSRVVFSGPVDIAAAHLEDLVSKSLQESTAVFVNTWPSERRTMQYWIRVRIVKAGYEIPPRLDAILVNTMTATHGQTCGNECFETTGLPFQSHEVKRAPVLDGSLELEVQEFANQTQKWSRVQDFDSSGPEDRHYVLDLTNGKLQFGDGIHGRIPPMLPRGGTKKENIKVVHYRAGGGQVGNVKADQVCRILDNSLTGITVTNNHAAVGGEEAETLDEAEKRARRDLKKITRPVTSSDYEQLALHTPGIRVKRAKALPQYHPQFTAIRMPGAVTVLVVPLVLPGLTENPPQPSSGFLKTVECYLRQRRLVTTNLFVIAPAFVPVQVKATVTIDARYDPETVRQDADKVLRDFIDPLEGGPDKNGWPFGRQVFKSEIYQILKNVDGVLCVTSLELSAVVCGETMKDNIILPRTGLVYSGKHTIQAVSGS